MSHPRVFSHLGIAVPDLDRAVAFYAGVFGLYRLTEPAEFAEDTDGDAPIGRVLTETYGPGWDRLRVARLVTADGTGIELQQFAGVPEPDGGPDGGPSTRRAGVSHFCVQDPDVEGLAARIVAHGGSRLSGVHDFYPGAKPFRLVYCADPFGNVIEVDSHGFETTYSPVSYPSPGT